jgi:hypothetical protein
MDPDKYVCSDLLCKYGFICDKQNCRLWHFPNVLCYNENIKLERYCKRKKCTFLHEYQKEYFYFHDNKFYISKIGFLSLPNEEYNKHYK